MVECAGKLALKSMWLWKESASTVQKCAKTASMRKFAKSAFLASSCMMTHAISPVPNTSILTCASVSPAMKTVWSAMVPRRMIARSVLILPRFSTMGCVWICALRELTKKKRMMNAKIAPSSVYPAHQLGPARPVRGA